MFSNLLSDNDVNIERKVFYLNITRKFSADAYCIYRSINLENIYFNVVLKVNINIYFKFNICTPDINYIHNITITVYLKCRRLLRF